MDSKWEWWSGRSDEYYSQGPFDKREDAIEEAFGQDDFEEEQLADGSWVGHVYVAEHKGTYFDCDECGRVEKACPECCKYLDRDEPQWLFAQTRNVELVTRVLPTLPSTPTGE